MSEQTIWNALRKELNPYAAAAAMGQFQAESAMRSNNLQDTYETALGFTDESYTKAVDNGVYSLSRFMNDCAGYGLCQWTYWTRKRSLYNYLKQQSLSIADEDGQVAFFLKEVKEYPAVYSILKTATSVKTASDILLTGYEMPADQSESAKNYRASLGQEFYNKYAGAPSTVSSQPTTTTSTTTANKYCDVKLPVLQSGSKGIPVYMLQVALKYKGYALGSGGIDGDFGPSTLLAVNNCRKYNNLSITGQVDKELWEVLIQ